MWLYLLPGWLFENTLEKNHCRKVEQMMHPMPLFILMQLLWTDIWKHIVETSQINNKLVQICLLSGRRFEKTFENTHRKRSNKCIQCNFVSSYTSTLNRHLKTHSGGKPNKCNQWEYPFCWAGDLRRHLTSQSGKKVKQMQPVQLCILLCKHFE